MIPSQSPAKPEIIILYDGLCGLCQRGMNFFRSEKTDHATWQFNSIQSQEALAMLDDWGLTIDDIHRVMHVINVQEQRVYIAEDAVAHCLQFCRFPWNILGKGMTLSWLKPVTARGYAWIAARRHRFLPPL